MAWDQGGCGFSGPVAKIKDTNSQPVESLFDAVWT